MRPALKTSAVYSTPGLRPFWSDSRRSPSAMTAPAGHGHRALLFRSQRGAHHVDDAAGVDRPGDLHRHGPQLLHGLEAQRLAGGRLDARFRHLDRHRDAQPADRDAHIIARRDLAARLGPRVDRVADLLAVHEDGQIIRLRPGESRRTNQPQAGTEQRSVFVPSSNDSFHVQSLEHSPSVPSSHVSYFFFRSARHYKRRASLIHRKSPEVPIMMSIRCMAFVRLHHDAIPRRIASLRTVGPIGAICAQDAES